MSELDDESQTDDTVGYIFAIAHFITTPIMLWKLGVHFILFYQDLYTAERKSVAHRRQNRDKKPLDYRPRITTTYKVVNYCILISSFCFTLANIFGVLTPFATTDQLCTLYLTAFVVLFQIAQTFMYIVFVARLYKVYECSPYSYPLKCIYFFVALLIIAGIIGVIIMITYNQAEVFGYGNINGFPNWCGPKQVDNYALFAGYVVAQDIGAVLGFLWAYILPLRKIWESIKNHEADSPITVLIAMKAHRTSVVAGFSTVSTVIFLFLTAAVSGVFAIAEIVVSQICIIMFSPYYSDERYYERYCLPCSWLLKKCCFADGMDLRDAHEIEKRLAEINSGDVNLPDIDAWSAVRIAGENTKVTFDYLLTNDGYEQRKATEMQQGVASQSPTGDKEENVEQKEEPQTGGDAEENADQNEESP